MRLPINILLEEDVYLSLEVRELKRNKKLSSHINNLLRESLNIKKTIINKDIEELDKEIIETKVKMTLLEEKKKNILAEEEKEISKWKTIL